MPTDTSTPLLDRAHELYSRTPRRGPMQFRLSVEAYHRIAAEAQGTPWFYESGCIEPTLLGYRVRVMPWEGVEMDLVPYDEEQERIQQAKLEQAMQECRHLAEVPISFSRR